MPLRLGFDGRALGAPAAGVRRYTRELFGALAALGEDIEVVAIGTPGDVALPPRILRGPSSRSLPTNAGWMLTGLPLASRAARLDLFHAPSYTAPVRSPRPLVLTIHDVSYARHPEWYPYRRDPFRRAFYQWSARTADRIITDSEFSRQEIVAAYGLSSRRIDVVPLAASAAFVREPRPPAARDAPFLLHVGDLHPRRNLEIAARALLRVRARRVDLASVRLVFAGVDRGAAGALSRAIAPAAGGLLDFRGRTSEEELVALYRGASALVYPSRYEGFGLPLLEAMACGTPVVAARAASIPEVTGEAATLVDPADETGWADAIESVFDPSTARRMTEAGVARAAAFSWRRTAEATLSVYRRALGDRA